MAESFHLSYSHARKYENCINHPKIIFEVIIFFVRSICPENFIVYKPDEILPQRTDNS